jgi:hypothetical protein
MRLFAGVGLLAISSGLALAGCAGSTRGSINSIITITPNPTTIPVNTKVTFKVNSDHPIWTLVGWSLADLGTPVLQIGGSTFAYTAPATPPVYPKNDQPAGVVTLQAQDGYDTALNAFTITAPSVTVGVSPETASVALGSTLTVYGYAVGSVNTQMTVQVDGVTGGSTATGTIAPTGSTYGTFTYTAPTTMPVSGSTINITIIAQADPTKMKTAVVTLH